MEWIKGILRGRGARVALLIFVFIIGVGIVFGSGGEDKESVKEKSLEEYKSELEAELSELCSSVRGVGKCKVSVSFSRGAENSYKGSMLVETKPPEVLGVIIVCKGADSDAVRRDLTELITSLYAIPSSRVAILKLN